METEVEETSKPKLSGYSKVGILMTSLSLAGLIYTVASQQPGIGGPITILFFLALVFLGATGITLMVLELSFRLFKLRRFSTIRLFYTSILVALAAVFIIGLQTLGQLQWMDVILIVIFELLLNFYLLRRF